jgi:pimeloyl-ACP methyl ester carboxylesterase
VLIEGLGYDSWMWYRQLPAFSRRFRVLVYDNRGVGRSGKPPGPYTHAQNAADLAGLLDYLGGQRAHVLGISMGGFIAQEFALAYPGRVAGLVLGCTGFGGPHMVPVSPEAQRALLPAPDLAPAEKIRRSMPIAFGNQRWPEEHREEFQQIIGWRLAYPQPPDAAVAQAMAALTFDTESRLGTISAPTLVIAGTADRVVPPENSRLLAAAIPGARLALLECAGHLMFIEAYERFNREVVEFLCPVV